ncbi:MAG TPA: hypothetical protein VMF59_01565 [Bacteroidota bacterium]|nr:hypothetical protein [Bacteroidota bacterium]
MNHRLVHRTLLWPVGLSSLLLFTPLFCFVVIKDGGSQQGQTMEVNLDPSPEKADAIHRNLPGLAPGGKWKQFNFVGRPGADSIMSAALDRAIRAHIATRDTVNGIRIHFERKARYGTFVGILDEINLAGLNHYAIVGPDIWVPCFPRKTKSYPMLRPPFICGGVIYPDPTPAERLQRLLAGYSFLSYVKLFSGPGAILVAWVVMETMRVGAMCRT